MAGKRKNKLDRSDRAGPPDQQKNNFNQWWKSNRPEDFYGWNQYNKDNGDQANVGDFKKFQQWDGRRDAMHDLWAAGLRGDDLASALEYQMTMRNFGKPGNNGTQTEWFMNQPGAYGGYNKRNDTGFNTGLLDLYDPNNPPTKGPTPPPSPSGYTNPWLNWGGGGMGGPGGNTGTPDYQVPGMTPQPYTPRGSREMPTPASWGNIPFPKTTGPVGKSPGPTSGYGGGGFGNMQTPGQYGSGPNGPNLQPPARFRMRRKMRGNY